MRAAPKVLALAAAVSLGWPLAAGATEETGRALRFNPFERPDLNAIGRAVDAPRASADGFGWAPVLRATLVAGEESLANLGGVVLAVGEEVHGYRLVAVDVWEAVFENKGSTLVLPVKPHAPQARRAGP